MITRPADDVINLFFQFIEQNNIKHLKNLIALINEKKMDIDLRKNGLTPLMFAAQHKIVNPTTIKELLIKFDLNAKNDEDQTAIQIATGVNNLTFIETCLEVNLATLSSKDVNELLVYFAKTNHFDLMKRLLQMPAINVNFKDRDGFTPLSIAAYKGHAELVSVLIKARATIDSIDDRISPLSEAKTVDVAVLLLEAKANIIPAEGTIEKLLCTAVKHNKFDETQALLNALKSVELENKKTQCIQNIKNYTLESAIDSEHISYVREEWRRWNKKASTIGLLLEAKAMISESYANGRHYLGELLILAAMDDDAEAVEILLEQKIDINYKNDNQYSALYSAAKYGNNDVLRLLLNARADVNIEGGTDYSRKVSYNYWGVSSCEKLYAKFIPVDVAEYVSTVCLLVEARAHIWHDNERYTKILTLVCELNQLDYIKILLNANVSPNHEALLKTIQHNNKEAIQLLLEKKADPNSVMSFAINNKKLDVAKLLLEAKANPSNELLPAVENNNIETVKFLLNSKADPNKGIIKAAENGDSDVIKLLLNAKADIATRNESNQTAADMAKNEQVKELLYNSNLPAWYLQELPEGISVVSQSIFQSSKPELLKPLSGDAPKPKTP